MRPHFVARVRSRDQAGRVGGPVVNHVVPDLYPPSPEIVELTIAPARVGPGRRVTWLACWVAVLGAVVGLGLADRIVTGAGPGGDPPGAVAVPGSVTSVSLIHNAVGALPAPSGMRATSGPTQPATGDFVVLLPAPGEVILAGVVPVAGRVAGPGPPRGVTPPTRVRVAIAADGAILGEADLPVVGGRFAGWVEVQAPVRARVVEIRVWDPLHPDRAPSIQTFVLRAPDGDHASAAPGS